MADSASSDAVVMSSNNSNKRKASIALTPSDTMDTSVDNTNFIQQQFLFYQQQLDTRHEKKELIFKTSRNITAAAKKVIFLLHRWTGDLAQKPKLLNQATNQLKQLTSELRTIHNLLSSVDDQYRFSNQYSPGIQEYIEAHAFLYYLQYGDLVQKSYIEEFISNEWSERWVISPLDYLMGVTDLGGEIMRFATNMIASGDRALISSISDFMSEMHSNFSRLQLHKFGRTDLESKIKVWKDSLVKIEMLCYKLQLRGAELPQSMLGSLSCAGPMIEHIEDAPKHQDHKEEYS